MRVALVALFIIFFGSVLCAAEEIKIGILAIRGYTACLERWGETGRYLSAKLGRTVTVVPLGIHMIDHAVEGKKVDFLLPNPSMFVEHEKKSGLVAVASMINLSNGLPVTSLGGVIFTRADSPINTLADIKGRRYAVVEFSSFGACQMQARELLQAGIDPSKDCSEYRELKKQDNVILAVKNGDMDVGSVRTDLLEKLEAEGQIKLSDFKIINAIKDDFPFVRSTRLYPEFPLARLAHTDDAISTALVSALRALTPSDEACKQAKIHGWTAPLDYSPVRDCLKEIKFGTFADD